MDNHIFRGAALGFNRQDVMEYIEKVQREAEAKTADLSGQLEEARREAETARQSLEDCVRERDALSQSLEELRERYDREKAEWESSSQAAAGQEDALRTLTAEKDRLEAQVRGLEGQMENLRREKEKLTQLELDAHRRSDELVAQAESQAEEIAARAKEQAQELQAQAQAQADALLAETRQKVSDMVGQCGELLRSCETITAHVSGELRRMDVAVAQLPIGMNHLKTSLAELLARSEEA